MNVFEILELLEKTSGRLDKEKILSDNKSNDPLLEVFKASLNPYKTYGITECGNPMIGQFATHQKGDVEDFLSILAKLSTREYSGDNARTRVATFLNLKSELDIKWYLRILQKNLRNGVSEKT